ncbi:hypothetical protein GCM10017673_05390 [Streptosporangium violaceochromogenes]|nr:hypothetical protein GCM10017673_05390 [Streptosporangium violaceochromogenes]
MLDSVDHPDSIARGLRERPPDTPPEGAFPVAYLCGGSPGRTAYGALPSAAWKTGRAGS